ncbi:MAG: hypothetical protein ACLTZI_07875 [[Eubacterium] siraeum]
MVVGTAAVGVHFVTKGNGIDYTVSGSSSGADSAVDASASKVNDNKSDVSDVVSKADENPSHADKQFRKRQQYDISRYKHLKGAGA